MYMYMHWWPRFSFTGTCYSRMTAQLISIHKSWAGISHPQHKTGASLFDAVGWDTNMGIHICVIYLLTVFGTVGIVSNAMPGNARGIWCPVSHQPGILFWHLSFAPPPRKEKLKNNYSLGFNGICVHSSNRNCPYRDIYRPPEKRQNTHARLKDLTMPSSQDESSPQKAKKKSI